MSADINLQVGAAIREARRSRNWAAAQVAEQAGMTHQNVYNLENARIKITVKQLYTFASILGVAPFELLPGADEWARASVTDLVRIKMLSEFHAALRQVRV
jgi:transcriptional regulator with XRE-family HTH domain